MKDIDFDELDRAVTSALNASGVSSNQSPQQDLAQSSGPDESSPEPATQNISSHTVHARIMSSGTPGRTTLARKPVVAARATTSIAEAIEVTKAPAPVSSPVKRSIPHREGRFMDVVHPGAKSTLPTPTITLAPKPTETPLPVEAEELSPTPEVAEESVAEKPHNASLEAAINNLFISEGHSPVASDTTEEPDETPPLEKLNATTVPADVAKSVSTDDAATDEIAAELGMPLEDARSNSPFISDAKVEKRPLGEIEQIDSLEASLEPVVEDVAELLPEMNETSNAPVPEELTSDIAAIESHEAGVENIAEPQVIEETPVETSAPELSSSGPTSIARQYKEQPRTASEDDESGAIFDPQTYQSPVEHPAKKSSGWGWVIACVLIIILATIAGVVAWMEGMLPVPL